MARNGILKSVTSTDPAANTEISYTVPAGKWWQLLSVTVECVQGATQTPWPSLVITDGTNVLFTGRSGTAAMSAATTTRHSWAPNLDLTGSAATTVNTGGMPANLYLGPGYKVTTVTTGIGANTNYGAAQFNVIEYDGPPEFC